MSWFKRIQTQVITALLLIIPLLFYFLRSQHLDLLRPAIETIQAEQNAATTNTFDSILGPVSIAEKIANTSRLDDNSGKVKLLKGNYTRVLVVPHKSNDSITWINDHIVNMDFALYMVDSLSASLHPPTNKGHEVMVYLSYIIEHYEQLPDILIFMHAHRHAWHNSDLLGFDAVEMVQRLNSERVIRHGYMNLRCAWDPGCPEWLHPHQSGELLTKQEQGLLARSWGELFPLDPLPTVLGQACCAQFAVSKEKVLSIPRQRFIFYRDWLLRTTLTDYYSGRIWEFTWQYVFTGYKTYCPAEYACYCDGFGVCFGGQAQYAEFIALRQSKNKYTAELETLIRQPNIESKMEQGKETDGDTTLEALRLGEEVVLRDQIEMLEKELINRRLKALERGKDSRNQAAELAEGPEFI